MTTVFEERQVEVAPEIKKQIICLVGSVKQEEDWRMWVKFLTIRGYVVLEVGLYGAVGDSISQPTWDLVTLVHHKKIEMCDVVGVIRKRNGTVGQHTQEDIQYAREHGKMVAKVESITYNGVYNDW
mgnify:CR=1 FL=1